MVKVIGLNEIETIKEYVDHSVFGALTSKQNGRFESYDNYTVMSFDWLDTKCRYCKHELLLIILTQQHLIFVCGGEKSMKTVQKAVKEEQSNIKVLHSFFNELIKYDGDYLQELEEQVTETEDFLIKTSKKASLEGIISFRKVLLRLKRYYEQLNRIFEELYENENGLIPESDLRHFKMLDSKCDRLFSHVLNLRDYVTQVREAYQAQIDIEQNKLMKVFTVVTSIFMPLTLIVGWYGMNLKLPEFDWDYGYPMVAGLCVAVTTFCILYFKRKKWF